MTKNKLFLIIFLFLIIIYFNILINNKRNYKISQPQILGFQINGIGNGHLTQALTVYKVLVKKYKIPVVIIYGRNEGYDIYFHLVKLFIKLCLCFNTFTIKTF